MIDFLEENTPKSEYLKLSIEELRKQETLKNKSDNQDIVFINGSEINSINDIINVQGIRGNKIYLDIWATWCNPCIQQFEYKEELHRLLSEYDDIVTVYLSIDDDKNDEIWKQKTQHFNLVGYNLRASESLKAELKKLFYENSSSMTIPRYILLDANGNILHKKLPKPQYITTLKTELDKVLKQP